MKAKQEVASSGSRTKGRLFGVFLSLIVIVAVIVGSYFSSMESRKTVSVVRIKPDNGGIKAEALITESMLERYDMYYKEFEQYGTVKFADGTTRSSVVLWEDRDKVVNTRYAGYYLREGTVLFWDETVKEPTKSNSYLYSMDGELLNIQMSPSDFGIMVVPGDVINVRAVYTDTVYNLPTEEAYKLSLEGNASVEGVEVQVIEPLFKEVAILDMLNSDKESIFDIYYNYVSLSSSQQAALAKDEDFLKSIEADSILLEVTAEQADAYVEIKEKSPTFLMTLLPRTGSNAIIDSLSELQSSKSTSSK